MTEGDGNPERPPQDGDDPGDRQGTCTAWLRSPHRCVFCNGLSVERRIWTAADPRVVDEQYHCPDCGHAWWMDASVE
jgi:hypothetical protein